MNLPLMTCHTALKTLSTCTANRGSSSSFAPAPDGLLLWQSGRFPLSFGYRLAHAGEMPSTNTPGETTASDQRPLSLLWKNRSFCHSLSSKPRLSALLETYSFFTIPLPSHPSVCIGPVREDFRVVFGLGRFRS